MRRRFQAERQHFRIGGRGVGAAERFDAGLQKFIRLLVAVTENRAEIAIARRRAGLRRGEIVARYRNGEIGPQAELVSARVERQIHALADVLAGKVEERLRWLQQSGREAGIARALIGSDQRLRPCVRHGRHGYCLVHRPVLYPSLSLPRLR